MYQRRFAQWDLVLLLTSYVKGVSTMLLPVAHIKYRITHMLCPTLYAAVTNELNDFLVIRLNGSPHQEVCEYYINTPPPPC